MSVPGWITGLPSIFLSPCPAHPPKNGPMSLAQLSVPRRSAPVEIIKARVSEDAPVLSTLLAMGHSAPDQTVVLKRSRLEVSMTTVAKVTVDQVYAGLLSNSILCKVALATGLHSNGSLFSRRH